MGIFDFLKRHKSNSKNLNTEDDIIIPTELKFILPNLSEKVINEHLIPKDIYVPKRKSELSGVTQEIWTYAPDEYNRLDWRMPPLPTMETNYEELRRGIEFVFRQRRFNDKRPELLCLVEESYLAYSSGDRKKGMELISQVQIMIGKMK